MTLSGTESGVEALSDSELQQYESYTTRACGPPYYHPQHGSGGTGQIERSPSSTTQHQRQPDVNWNPIVTHGVERQSNTGYNGTIGDGTKADRVCGLRPSCLTRLHGRVQRADKGRRRAFRVGQERSRHGGPHFESRATAHEHTHE